MIIVNTKSYKTGETLVRFAKLVASYEIHTILAVPAMDIHCLASHGPLTIYAQHLDAEQPHPQTGATLPAMAQTHGAEGTLLNHSERPLQFDLLKKTIEQCKQAKLVTVVCASSLGEAQKIAQLKPSAIAFEDPKLIGTGKSITTTRAHDIEKFVQHLKGKPSVPLCGAGISSIADIKAAYRLGCEGVLIASALTNAKNPKPFLEALAAFIKQLDA